MYKKVNDNSWRFMLEYLDTSLQTIFKNMFNAILTHFVVGKVSSLAKDNQPITICLNVYLIK